MVSKKRTKNLRKPKGISMNNWLLHQNDIAWKQHLRKEKKYSQRSIKKKSRRLNSRRTIKKKSRRLNRRRTYRKKKLKGGAVALSKEQREKLDRRHKLSLQNPRWIPDEDKNECMICGVNFTFFNRRHHCRSCGWVVCDSCSRHRLALLRWLDDNSHFVETANVIPGGYTASSKVLRRVCNLCQETRVETSVELREQDEATVAEIAKLEAKIKAEVAAGKPVGDAFSLSTKQYPRMGQGYDAFEDGHG